MDLRFGGSILARASALQLAGALLASAAFPLGNMDSRSLGIQYGLAFRGQNITASDVPSHETIHTLGLAYAPVPFVAVEAGVGLDRMVVDRRNSVGFRGDFGFSPTFGIDLASPPFLQDLLRVTGGLHALYLNSPDGNGFRYSGLISSPFLGISVSPAGIIEAETGVRGHIMDGTMREPGGTENYFSNGEIVRGYLSVTLKSPQDRAFLTLDADVSPGFDSDWSRGPREAKLGVSFGAFLGRKRNAAADRDSSVYFPDFPEMRNRLKKMAGESE